MENFADPPSHFKFFVAPTYFFRRRPSLIIIFLTPQHILIFGGPPPQHIFIFFSIPPPQDLKWNSPKGHFINYGTGDQIVGQCMFL